MPDMFVAILFVFTMRHAIVAPPPDDLRAVVEDTDDEPTLVAWLRLAGTRGAGDIGAAIRAFRAS